jgi:spermidine synthase
VVKLQLSDLHQTGRVVGKLSGIGTLGAITATLGTGFVLVAALPTSVIVLGLAGLLVVAGLALGRYLRRTEPLRSTAARRGRAVAAVVGLAGAGLAVTAPNPCDVETAYHCARIVADPHRLAGRLLVLNSARHSYVDLTDPRHLEFAYTRWIGALADVMAAPGVPLDVLHLGGGGFTLPRYVGATRPGSKNLVLELDGALVALDGAELGVQRGPELEIRIGDGRVGLARVPAASRDLVIGDAFGYLVVPWHLATRELVADVRRTLRPGGVYALNAIDRPPARFVRAEIATVAAVFRYVAVVAPPDAVAGRQAANFVLLASDVPLPLDALRARLDAATVLAGAELAAFSAGARVLTDDRAPVDQLIAQGG